MRFLADMGVDIRVADWHRERGHDALHLREHGMHRASDEAIFAKAIAEDRIVLTFDLDFERWPRWHAIGRLARCSFD